MAVHIRLSRGGAKRAPFYKIVAADSRSPRDGKFIERLGHFNPMLPKDHQERLVMNTERVKYWVGVGAKPSDRVTKMMAEMGLCEKPAIPAQTKKSQPKAKAQERMKELAAKEAAKLEAEAAAKAEAEAAKAAPAAPAAPVAEETTEETAAE